MKNVEKILEFIKYKREFKKWWNKMPLHPGSDSPIGMMFPVLKFDDQFIKWYLGFKIK